MNNYVTHYILPVLAIMAGMLVAVRIYGPREKFRKAVLVSVGFLLGWASAFLSLAKFHL
jgi:hypothetical protein